jgi:hypothetical protein
MRVAILTLALFVSLQGNESKKSDAPKDSFVGRVIAAEPAIMIYLGSIPTIDQFIFELKATTEADKPQFIKVIYHFYPSRDQKPFTHIARSGYWELNVVRNPACDETVPRLRAKDETLKSGRNFVATTAEDEKRFPSDSRLDCYVLKAGHFKRLN